MSSLKLQCVCGGGCFRTDLCPINLIEDRAVNKSTADRLTDTITIGLQRTVDRLVLLWTTASSVFKTTVRTRLGFYSIQTNICTS